MERGQQEQADQGGAEVAADADGDDHHQGLEQTLVGPRVVAAHRVGR